MFYYDMSITEQSSCKKKKKGSFLKLLIPKCDII